MQYVVKTTPQFKRDYRRAKQAGRDMRRLDEAILALAAGPPPKAGTVPLPGNGPGTGSAPCSRGGCWSTISGGRRWCSP